MKQINLIYYSVFFLWYLLSLLPLRFLYFISDLLFYPLYYCIRYRRKIIRNNLSNSFPEKDLKEIVQIEKQFYSFFCDYIVETLKLFSISKKQLMRRMTFEGLDEIVESMNKKNKDFCFIYLGHYCNWEWIASLPYWISKDISCGQIYHPLYNQAFDKLFLRLRNQFGGECIPMKTTLRRIIELKRTKQKAIIGFISDQAPKWNSIHCLVIDKRNHRGGNIYCEDIEGIHVHKYGAHIFHTDNKEVWDYVNSFVEFNRYTNSPLAYFDGKLYNLPFNMNTFYQLWGVKTPAEAKAKIEEQRKEFDHIATPANLEEQALKLCGKDIYHRLIKGYTEKQWGRSAKELPAFIIKRIPFRFIYDNNYFNDSYQGIPKGGYNALIDALLEGTEVRLNTNYFSNRNELDALADNILFTGCIDQFFDYQCGHLEYRSLRFEHKQLETEDFQGNAVVNYTEREVPYTRIIEHKHFEFGTQPTTVITYEYPDDFAPGKEPYYPINDKRNTEMMSQYKKLASERKDVLFGGRLAQYAYADMDDTVAAALALCKKTFK